MRDVVDGLMSVLSTGCQWRAIPKDLPPRSTVHGYFDLWDYDGTLKRIHHVLSVACREQAGREASPTAAIIDPQSVKSAEKGGGSIDPGGYDAGKKIKGKKRHVLVDTQGLLMHAIVHAADIQDRDGGVLLMATLLGFIRFCSNSTPTGDTKGRFSKMACVASVRLSKWRSSSDPTSPRASSCSPSDGSSNAPSLGSIAAAAWRKTGNASPAKVSHSSIWLLSASWSESSAKPQNDFGQTPRGCTVETFGDLVSRRGPGRAGRHVGLCLGSPRDAPPSGSGHP